MFQSSNVAEEVKFQIQQKYLIHCKERNNTTDRGMYCDIYVWPKSVHWTECEIKITTKYTIEMRRE